MLKELDDYDWAEAFGEGGGGNTTNQVEEAYGCADTAFGREDVEEILYLEVNTGEYAETDCHGVFRLKDGRYAAVSASCDSTGWDCRAHNTITVASDIDTILRLGVIESVRGTVPKAVIKREKARCHHPDNAPFATALPGPIVELPQAPTFHPDMQPFATAL